MIIEVKVPAMTSVEIAMLNEDLNQVVYNHTGVLGESKISEPTIKSDNSKVIATLQAELEKAKEDKTKFAIAFADWINENEWSKITHSLDGKIGNWMNDNIRNITTQALVDLFIEGTK